MDKMITEAKEGDESKREARPWPRQAVFCDGALA